MTKKLRFIFLTLFIVLGYSFTEAATFNSRVVATSSNPDQGTVYAKFATTSYNALAAIFGGNTYTHKDPTAPSAEDYKEEAEDVYNGHQGGNTSCQVKIFLYAQPAEGYVFDHWVINNSEKKDYVISDANCSFIWGHSTKAPNTLTTTAVAYFRPESAVSTYTNFPGTLITLSKEKPQIGDDITATFTEARIAQSGTPGNKNMMAEFSHWEDEEGTVLSYDKQCDFHVDREMTVCAIFRTLGEVPRKGKYYRVRNVYNRVLSVEGSYTVNVTGAMDLDTSLLRWVLPTEHDYEEFWTGRNNNEWYGSDENPLCVEESPSTIFYVEEGTTTETGMTKGSLSAQGVNTKSVTGNNTFDVVDVDPAFYGYYGITSSAFASASLQWQLRENGTGTVNISQFKASSNNCAFAIQPIDEAHVDLFWFGAYAPSEMYYDGGYWTSMYTAFPYKLYDPGVKAYYVSGIEQSDGKPYTVLKEIEDRIVPAYTSVLLKCDEPENTKVNRMIPLSPDEVQKTAPEDNLLKGAFQLNEYKPGSREYEDTRIYNSSNIRMLDVNNSGVVGLFNLSGDNSLLEANKVYLDTSALPESLSEFSFPLGVDQDATTGVESISVDEEYDIFAPGEVYDLTGRRVTNPISGKLYIVNGTKRLWK